MKYGSSSPKKNIQKFKTFHPRVSINVEFQIDLGGELVRSSTIRIDEKRWKMISPEVSESMGQDDCHRDQCHVPSGEKGTVNKKTAPQKTAMSLMWIVRLSRKLPQIAFSCHASSYPITNLFTHNCTT